MIIRVADLEPRGLHVQTPLVVGPLRTDADEDIGIEGAFLQGDVRRMSRGVELRGRLTCRALLPCARCLSRFPVEVTRSFHLRYAFGAPSGKDIEIAEEDLDLDFLEADGELDLAAVASEQVYLELPMKPMCGKDCRGLCPRCGANLNLGACGCGTDLPHL